MKSDSSIQGIERTAIVGIGETEVGEVPGASALELSIQAIDMALIDAGLDWSDLDGIVSTESRVSPFSTCSPMIAEYMGINPRLCITMPVGGMQFVGTVFHAASLVAAGYCDVVALVCADNLRTGFTARGAVDHYADTGHPLYENSLGATIPSLYGLIAQRYVHDVKNAREAMAEFAVQMRRNASRHPKAQKRDLITADDVLKSPMIADPLRRLDCSLISDGGSAFILTSGRRAETLRERPVNIRGAGEGRSHQNVTQAKSLSHFETANAARLALSMAGITVDDLDVAFLYDPFSVSPLIAMESIGLCEPRMAPEYVLSGAINRKDLGGKLPINTHGGLMSYAHPGRPGASHHLVESVLQLRGQAENRQVDGAHRALVQANAGITSGEYVLILESN